MKLQNTKIPIFWRDFSVGGKLVSADSVGINKLLNVQSKELNVSNKNGIK
jgi:hypothetical protein